MTARSIPEILGWERADDYEVPSSWWVDGTLRDGWTVDDLLAWLRERVYDLEMMYQAVGYMVEIRRTRDSDARPEYLYGDTLLAALELAVRAVAGES